jgi:ketosteroid isomerase-like protein
VDAQNPAPPDKPIPVGGERDKMTDKTTDETRGVVNQLLERLGGGDIAGVVELFAEDAHWEIPGDPDLAPWVGRRKTHEIADFFRTIGEHTDRELFEIERIVVDGPYAVLIGRARVAVRTTGQIIDTPFAVDIVVNSEGRISRYYMFEDSLSVARAMQD